MDSNIPMVRNGGRHLQGSSLTVSAPHRRRQPHDRASYARPVKGMERSLYGFVGFLNGYDAAVAGVETPLAWLFGDFREKV